MRKLLRILFFFPVMLLQAAAYVALVVTGCVGFWVAVGALIGLVSPGYGVLGFLAASVAFGILWYFQQPRTRPLTYGRY